jgi:guanylate kinase
MTSGRLFILSAASGTGKTSLAKALVERVPGLAAAISHTTRAPRPGEQHGVHYYFAAPAEFERMVAAGEFLEHAQVFGNRYGTSRKAVEQLVAEGKRVLLDIDWQGAHAIKQAMPNAISVFLLPPSRETLEQRLQDRRQDPPEVIARRMREAVSEMRHYDEFDHVVVNDDFELALNDLRLIINGEPQRLRAVNLDVGTLLRD